MLTNQNCLLCHLAIAVATLTIGESSLAEPPRTNQAAPESGVFNGKLFYEGHGNVVARIELQWTTDRQLVGLLMQGEHQQHLTNKQVGFVGSVQELRGYPVEFRSFELTLGDVFKPSQSASIKTWPPGTQKMRFSWESDKLAVHIGDAVTGSLFGLPPTEIPEPEKPSRPLLPSDWKAEESLHGDWAVASTDGQSPQGASPSQIYRFSQSQMSVWTGGQVSSVLNYVTRPDLSPSAIDVIRFSDGTINVSRMNYRVDGDHLTIAFAPPNAVRPSSFEPLPGISVVQFIRVKLRRVDSSRGSLAERALRRLRFDDDPDDKVAESDFVAVLRKSPNPIDQCMLAVLHAAGSFGVDKDISIAKKLAKEHFHSLRASADQQDPIASFLVWRLATLKLISETGFDADKHLAIAVRAGLPNAQRRLAMKLLEDEEQSEAAYRWLTRAAAYDSLARQELAYWHLDQTQRNRKSNELGWVLAIAGARDGRIDLPLRVGYEYEIGRHGKRDLPTAIQWYEVASALGNQQGMHNLGVHAANAGRLQEALSHFESAAQGGFEDSKVAAAKLYLEGRGVKQDLKKAKELLVGIDSSEAKSLLSRIKVNSKDGSLSLRSTGGSGTGPSYSGGYDQLDHERQMRQLKSSMRQNIGRRTGIFFEDR